MSRTVVTMWTGFSTTISRGRIGTFSFEGEVQRSAEGQVVVEDLEEVRERKATLATQWGVWRRC